MDKYFDKVCRTCMKTEGKLRSIFSNSKKISCKYSDLLQLYASLQVEENDDLPKKICTKCVYNLTAFHQFKKICLQTDQLLKQRILENNLAKRETPVTSENIINPSPKEVTDQEAWSENVENNELTEIKNDNEEVTEKNKKYNPVEVLKVIIDECTNVKVDEKDTNKLKSGQKKRLTIKKRSSKPHQCEICGKFLSCRSNLVQHMRQHTGEKPYSCDVCEKSFARAEHVTIHKRIHTGERPHTCDVCGKAFVQYAALSCHVRTHTGEKPHRCTACGKSFAQAVTLTYHMRTHTGETPYTCRLCGKGFTHSGNLNIHMRFHNGERPFSCNICGQRFVTSSHLTVHLKHHTGEKNHRCNVCSKAFVRKEHLRDHMLTHTGQKPHCCKLCTKCYSQSSHLARHMKTHKYPINETPTKPNPKLQLVPEYTTREENHCHT